MPIPFVIPGAIWALLALLGAGGVLALFGMLINAITIILFFIMGYILLTTAMTTYSFADEKILPGVMALMGIASFIFGIWLLNPGLFQTQIHFSMVGEGTPGSLGQPLSIGQLFAPIPYSQSIMGNLNPYILIFLGVLIVVSIYAAFRKRKKGK